MNIDTRAQEIDFEGDSNLTFFLIHGYTGSPTDFNGLPEYINKEFGARVRVALLPGHGTSVHDLDKVNYKDIVGYVEEEFEKERQKAGEIIVGGVSFGALMALRMAEKYPVKGVVNVSVPYSLKVPFGLPGMRTVFFYKKYWKKKISEPERLLREKAFHYPEMHIKGLTIVKEARREVAKDIKYVDCPVLTVHSVSDPIGGLRGVYKLKRRIRSPHEVIIFNNKNHNIFYSEKRDDVYKEIGKFINKSQGEWKKA